MQGSCRLGLSNTMCRCHSRLLRNITLSVSRCSHLYASQIHPPKKSEPLYRFHLFDVLFRVRHRHRHPQSVPFVLMEEGMADNVVEYIIASQHTCTTLRSVVSVGFRGTRPLNVPCYTMSDVGSLCRRISQIVAERDSMQTSKRENRYSVVNGDTTHYSSKTR